MCRWAAHYLNEKAIRLANAQYLRACEESGERRVSGINVVGSDAFRDAVSKALTIIRLRYPFGFRLIQRYLSAVVAADKDAAFGFASGIRFEPTDRLGRLRWSPDRFAAILVRSAVYRRAMCSDIVVWRNPDLRLLAATRELKAVCVLGCSPEYIRQQRQFVTDRCRKSCRKRSWAKEQMGAGPHT